MAKKVAKKKPVARKRTPAKRTTKKTTARRAPSAVFMKPLQPSAELAKVVGEKPIARTEVVKRVWAYIKKHGLQDRRNINADEALRPVFGGKKTVTMFEMTSLVNKHLS